MFRKKNVLVVGCNGMLGSHVLKRFVENAKWRISSFNIVSSVDMNELDISDELKVKEFFSAHDDFKIKYDVVINCAAITDTTACEKEKADLSYKVNALGPLFLAKECSKRNIHLVHVSTDYVFSEHSFDVNGSHEFPVNMYGMHKLIGEKNIECAYGKNKNWTILRTSWLYGPNFPKTFIHKFLKNCKKAVDDNTFAVNVTDDNFGKPTSCQMLCQFIYVSIIKKLHGKMDAQYLGDVMSRAEFANEILKACSTVDEFSFLKNVKINKIKSSVLSLPIRHPTTLICSTKTNVTDVPLCETCPTIGIDKYVEFFSSIDKSYALKELCSFIKSESTFIKDWLCK